MDGQRWASPSWLWSSIFEWIEAFYNPCRRRSGIGSLAPTEYEALHSALITAA